MMSISTASAIETRLRQTGFKRMGNQLRGSSPFRQGSDSNGFSVTIDGPENGAYFDHASGEHGSLYDLAERLGIERPERQPVEQTKVPYRDMAEYTEKHGAPVSAFEKARWEEVQQDGRPAMRFDTAHGPRFRFLDGNKPAFKSPVGYESCWYGIVRATDMAHKDALPLVLVNGEASTVVCQHWGIPGACVTSGGERKLKDSLLKELRARWSGKIIIAMDCAMPLAGRRLRNCASSSWITASRWWT